MKKILPGIILPVIITFAFACTEQPKNDQEKPQAEAALQAAPSAAAVDEHNSRNALTWSGVYTGVIPCADCEGIETSITLMKDNTFSRKLVYLGKGGNPIVDKGSFTWDSAGAIITITGNDGVPQHYKVGENVLFHLDQSGNMIQGELAAKYRLLKNRTDARMEEKKWILTELMGKPAGADQTRKQAFLNFNPETSTVAGNGGCNALFGPYELKEGDRISFGNLASTMMACPDMAMEKQLLEVLSKVDNYTVADTVLSLNKARMAPLARFVLATEK